MRSNQQQPKYSDFRNHRVSPGYVRLDLKTLILEWAQRYIADNYVPVGFVNIIAPDRVEYYFDDIPQQVPELGEFILIYQRKP